jgi:hypothetical protein
MYGCGRCIFGIAETAFVLATFGILDLFLCEIAFIYSRGQDKAGDWSGNPTGDSDSMDLRLQLGAMFIEVELIASR